MFIHEFNIPGPGGGVGLHVGIWREQHNMTLGLAPFNQPENVVNKTDEVSYKIHVKNMNPHLWCMNLRALVSGSGSNASHAPIPANQLLDYVDPATHAAIGRAMTTMGDPPWSTHALEGSDLRYLLFTPLAPYKLTGSAWPDEAVSGLRIDVDGMDLPAHFETLLRFHCEWVEKPAQGKPAEPYQDKFGEKITD